MPTNPNIDTALTLLTPYVMYIGAEHFHFSGVMAVVSGGLFLSYRSHRILTFQSRLQSHGVWSTVIFLINGTVFILIGLELPVIVNGLQGVSKGEVIKYGLLISALTIGIRFVWTYINAFLPRYLFKSILENEKNPGWKGAFVISFAAMRGVVSLAAAFSIPLVLTTNEAFPQRNTILFITFIVILVTLVGQGLALPFLLKWLDIKEIDDIAPEEEQEAGIQIRLKQAALQVLIEKHKDNLTDNELVANLKTQLENDLSLTRQKLDSLECAESNLEELSLFHQVTKELIQVQREELAVLRTEKLFTDEMLRKQAAQLDLDEARLTGMVH